MQNNLENSKKFEEFKQMFYEKEAQWFENNFIDKPFHDALYESWKKPIVALMQAMCQFMFLHDSLVMVKNNKTFYKNLSKEDKQTLKEMIAGGDEIINHLNDVLIPLQEGLS